MLIKTKKTLIRILTALVLFFCFAKVVLAIPSIYQKCDPNTDCIIGEYLFENDGHTAITTDDYCKITITNPNDSVIVNAVNMSDKNDGWYYYTANVSSPEGLYRALICCDVGGSEYQCLDKTFIGFYLTFKI